MSFDSVYHLLIDISHMTLDELFHLLDLVFHCLTMGVILTLKSG